MAEAFDAVETVRSVLRTLEEQYVVVSLVRDILDRGLSVAIGSELGLEPLASCSVVVAPFEVDGEPAGSIGVVGPTRMNYEQALASVGDREPAPRPAVERGLGSVRCRADYYEVLGVAATARPDEIKRAYRRLARELHPDANPESPEAKARFKEVAQAYEVLSNPERRERYDRFGPEGVSGFAGDAQGFGGLGDLFDAFFGGGFGGPARAGGSAARVRPRGRRRPRLRASRLRRPGSR